MRVAYVCADPGVDVHGRKGASIHVQEVVRALGRRGARVELFAARAGGPVPPGLEQVALRRLPEVADADPARRERLAQAANAELEAVLHEAGPFDVVYERYSLFSVAGMRAARHMGAVGLLEVNAPLVQEQLRHRVLVDVETAERCARTALSAATAVVAVSAEVADWARARTPDPSLVHVIPNGVDPRRFAPARPSRDRAGVTVGFVGTLKPWHGVESLVRAFTATASERRGDRLLVVGDGPRRAPVRDLAVTCGVADLLTMTGSVAHERIPSLLADMDIAVAPYTSSAEGYFSPLKLYEYQAAGLPVVASAVGQVREAVRHGETGLLVEPGDVGALADALARLRDDPPLRRRLGAAARRHVVATRSWDAVADRLLALASPHAAGVR